MLRQIINGLQPTRNLKTRYLLNSNRIKRASQLHESGLIRIWQFLGKCSFACAGYEQRQRNWNLEIALYENDVDDESEINVYNHSENPQEEIINHGNQVQVLNNTTYCMKCLVIVTPSGDNVSQYIALPSGHAWTCEDCVSILANQFLKICPMCRGDVYNYQRIFFN